MKFDIEYIEKLSKIIAEKSTLGITQGAFIIT